MGPATGRCIGPRRSATATTWRVDESGNILMGLMSEEDAEVAVRTMAADWAQRNCFFWGVFERET